MKTKSNFHVSLEGITLGDHLVSLTPDCTRHGIYVGKCRVITVKLGVVSEESLEDFSSGEALDIYLQKSDFAAAEIARRAKSQVGFVIGTWDDRCFCEWCIKGLLVP